MEVQLTDFENAAFSVFIVLLSRAILSFNVNFYIPISKVDENMKRAHHKDAVRQQKFHFRKNVFNKRSRFAKHFAANGDVHANGNGHGNGSTSRSHSRTSSVNPSAASSSCTSPVDSPGEGDVDDEYEEMSLDEIINGKPGAGSQFPGLLSLVRAYMSSLNVDYATKCELERYLAVIEGRANGAPSSLPISVPCSWADIRCYRTTPNSSDVAARVCLCAPRVQARLGDDGGHDLRLGQSDRRGRKRRAASPRIAWAELQVAVRSELASAVKAVSRMFRLLARLQSQCGVGVVHPKKEKVESKRDAEPKCTKSEKKKLRSTVDASALA